MNSELKIEQLWIPDSLEDPDAEDFLAAVEVARKVRMQTWGTDDLAYTPIEKLLEAHDPYDRLIVLVAKLDGQIVGVVDISLPLVDNSDLAELTLDILPDYQHRGLGRELVEAAELYARAEGRRMILVDTNHPLASLPDLEAEQLPPETGAGYVPLSSREANFARRTGYTLERIEQFSACNLPLDSALIAELELEADQANDDRYRLHHWTDHCPQRWLNAVAQLENSVGEDGRYLGADSEQMTFDSSMMRETEELSIAQGRRMVVTAVEHINSGALVGITTIAVLAHRQDVVFQDDTQILEEHRGNKLGLLIKVANMERLCEQFPDARVIYTWNALENRYLLTVNRQLGFVSAGVTGIWQKELPDFSPATTS
ncbi:GNAT family N-acetyltransferase [Pseudarthrobacter sp. J1738]|uniref:GNAT family N-acetyltransferase n=1 Tax=unclassified Pseudarthrobacter TaxID=2647000 RepID=UPI003D2BB1B0